MALKEEIVFATDGRDKGKTFVINEMPCRKVEKWAARALLALARGGVDLDIDPMAAGMADLASLAIRSIPKLDFELAEPLLDEMMACVDIRPDPKNPQVQRQIVENDIDEVATLLKLRMAWIKLHTGFSMPGGN